MTALGLDGWWDTPAYKQCDTVKLRAEFILTKLMQHDAEKFRAMMADLLPEDGANARAYNGLRVANHPRISGRVSGGDCRCVDAHRSIRASTGAESRISGSGRERLVISAGPWTMRSSCERTKRASAVRSSRTSSARARRAGRGARSTPRRREVRERGG